MIMADTVTPFTYLPGTLDWLRFLPEIIVLGAALLVLLADLVGSVPRRPWLAPLATAGILGAAVSIVWLWSTGDQLPAFYAMVASDHFALLTDAIILTGAGLGVLLSPGYIQRQGIHHAGEYYALMLAATFGMMLMASADNLMTVFVGLEILSLSLYILSAYVVTRERSQEAGLKYFILSSFASGFLLYGMALTYGATGSTSLAGIRAFLTHTGQPLHGSSGYGPLLLAALGLMAVGFAFKVSAIPFQAWTPDVYTGAPTSVTAFMSTGTKVAAFAALVRVFLVALHPVANSWVPIFWIIAVATMIGGNLMAITQTDVKRMLAYSSIANAGYMLVAIVTDTRLSVAALAVYLTVYTAMNIGAFGVVLVVERRDGQGTALDDFAGLSRRRPALAAVMAIFLFALAGLPPTAGFAGKWYVFYAAVLGDRLELAIIGVLASVAGMFYYLRVIWAMYFVETDATVAVASAAPASPGSRPAEPVSSSGGVAVAVAAPAVPTAQPAVRATVVTRVSVGEWIALAIAILLTLGLGLFPSALFNAATQASQVLFR